MADDELITKHHFDVELSMADVVELARGYNRTKESTEYVVTLRPPDDLDDDGDYMQRIAQMVTNWIGVQR